MEKINTLKQFYDFMLMTKNTKQQIFDLFMSDKKQKIADMALIEKLKEFVYVLKNIEKGKGQDKYRLLITDKKSIEIDLSYEIGELEKDIYFLSHSEDEFFNYLESIHERFSDNVAGLVSVFEKIRFKNFVTDRDGTVNNYCGRYISSIQSIYNAVFLYRFAANSVENAVILTSAPLDNIGMADISLMPKNVFIYAGSKGREYFDKQGNRHQFEIDKKKQKKLDLLNQNLKQLLAKPEYEIFTLIGSGLQLKFGQTTIARQDISATIETARSLEFLNLIRNIVKDIDPDGHLFRIEDTGKDIEIMLTIEDQQSAGDLKDFDKGDSVNFLDQQLGLDVVQGPNLICGDTGSDVAMVRESAAKCQNTWAVFVTDDQELMDKVKSMCSNSLFVSTPDILVMALNQLAKNRRA